jgi:hypothetical protein
MADRIQARALRRAGELLKRIEPAKTGPKQELDTGAHTQLGRQAAAGRAGMSRHQTATAVRVANVPAEKFEAAVEADKPATVTALAEMGKQSPQSRRVDATASSHRLAGGGLRNFRDVGRLDICAKLNASLVEPWPALHLKQRVYCAAYIRATTAQVRQNDHRVVMHCNLQVLFSDNEIQFMSFRAIDPHGS